jgi:hypothetical protein
MHLHCVWSQIPVYYQWLKVLQVVFRIPLLHISLLEMITFMTRVGCIPQNTDLGNFIYLVPETFNILLLIPEYGLLFTSPLPKYIRNG